MKLLLSSLSMIVILVFFSLPTLCLEGNKQDPDNIFQKFMDDNENVVVKRVNVAYVPISPQDQKLMDDSGFIMQKPDSVGLYSLYFTSKESKQTYHWQKKVNEYNSSKVTVYDVIKNKDSVVVLYDASGFLQAEILKPNQPANPNVVVEKNVLIEARLSSTESLSL